MRGNSLRNLGRLPKEFTAIFLINAVIIVGIFGVFSPTLPALLLQSHLEGT